MLRLKLNIAWFLLGIVLIIVGYSCQKLEIEREIKISASLVQEIKQTSAEAHSIIVDSACGINSYGHCWSDFENPTILDFSTNIIKNDTSGLTFFSEINNLEPGKRYYVRAYAINNNQIVYGKEETFETPTFSLPIVSTSQILTKTSTTIFIDGQIISFGDGFTQIKNYGHCWSQNSEPTINDNKTDFGGTDSLVTFTSLANDLVTDIPYYIRSYATNELGTAYGEIVNFSTIAGKPLVEIEIIDSLLTSSSIFVKARIIDNGGSPIISEGFEVNICPDLFFCSVILGMPDEDTFSFTIKPLDPNTCYNVRAYAQNGTITGYSTFKSFKTLP